MLASFEGPIKQPRAASAYQLGMVFVLVAILLLPLVYLALTAGVGAGTWWHLMHNAPTPDAGGRASLRFQVILYIAPAFVGLTLLVILLKPLFAPPAVSRPLRPITRGQQPLLFTFIDELCRTVGAPVPVRVQVDSDINASAGLHQDMVSITRNGLVLTIGLPLVTGMSLRQFGGVLAHEFGHFRQGVGMRASYVVRRITAAFARAVYQRDAVDQWLVELSESESGLSLLAMLARACVWVVRGILWLLMMTSHALSSFLLRQMEHDADLNEIRFAGSDTFGATCRQLRLLGAASEAVFSELSESWTEGRLSEDYPGMVAARARSAPKSVLSAIARSSKSSRTGIFDTHPADSERMRRARAEKAPGIFRPEGPATVLFQDLDELSKRVTMDLYRAYLGDEVSSKNLVANAVLAGKKEEQQSQADAIPRYFAGVFDLSHPLFLKTRLIPTPVAGATASQLPAVRSRFESATKNAQASLQPLLKAHEARIRVARASELVDAGIAFDASELSVPSATVDGVERARNRADQMYQRAYPAVDALLQTARERLTVALAGLNDSALEGRIPDVATRRIELQKLLPALAAMETAHPEVVELRGRCERLLELARRYQENEENTRLHEAIGTRMNEVRTALTRLQGPLCRVPYPFAHIRGEISLGQQLLPDIPPIGDFQAIVGAAQSTYQGYLSIYQRLMGQLVLSAEAVETAVSNNGN